MDGNPISGEWNKDFPYIDPSFARKIIKSEIDGGMKVENLPVGKTLEFRTENHTYTLEHRSDGYYLSGHPDICPEPMKVEIIGSNFGGSALKKEFIGRGLFLEFKFTESGEKFISSEIQDMHLQ